MILIGNHSNQFIDGMNLVSCNDRAISFLIAKKSYDCRVIGDVAKLLNAVPVLRPQDVAKKGGGVVCGIARRAAPDTKRDGGGEEKATTDGGDGAPPRLRARPSCLGAAATSSPSVAINEGCEAPRRRGGLWTATRSSSSGRRASRTRP